jgi:hypothetical protein
MNLFLAMSWDGENHTGSIFLVCDALMALLALYQEESKEWKDRM